MKQVLVTGLALLQIISGACASNILISTPPQENGNLVACVGDEISLTCSHNNAASTTTQWTISSPVNCSTDITHTPPTPVAPPCGPFSFQNITLAEASVIQLNSTAVATASSEISGSIIECIAGFVSPVSVGNISLCVIDELPAPINLRCLQVPNGLSVSWDVVPDESNSCARSSIVYVVTVVGEANGTIISMNDAQAEITDLEPGQNYSISVRARLAQGTCETREAATVVCRTSDDLSPTTTTPGDEGTSTVAPEIMNGNAVSAAAVAVPIVLILLAVAIAAIVGVLIFVYYNRHDKKLPFNIPLPFRKLKDQNNLESSPSRPPTELKHTKAPSGDMYTVIDKIPTKSMDNEDNSNEGLFDDSIDKGKDQDIPVKAVDDEAKEADEPPPKPKRTNKSNSKAKNKSKNEPSPQPAPLPGAYEDIDDF